MNYFWNIFFYWCNRAAPARSLTWLCGWLAEWRWPPLKNFLIKSFIKAYNVNMAQALETNYKAYATFNEFFTRELHPQSYTIDSAPESFVSPAQGTLSSCYQLNERFLCESKNLWLQGDQLVPPAFLNGNDNVRVIYLSPADYHRVHAPCDGVVIRCERKRGRLLSVAPCLLEIDPQLLAHNDRVTMTLQTPAGYVSIVFVGAIIVGSIVIHEQELPYSVKRGQELGLFKLGSTIIILAPHKIDMISYQGAIQIGARIGLFKQDL